MADIIDMPKLSDTMTVGTLVRWLKEEGDSVAPGDMLAEVETDKATMEVENFTKGILLKRYVKAGESVPIGAPMCAVGQKDEKAPAIEASHSPSKAATEQSATLAQAIPPVSISSAKAIIQETAAKPEDAIISAPLSATLISATPAKPVFGSSKLSGTVRIKASPLARMIALEQGIDLSQVRGSGPGGRVIREDVLQAPKQSKSITPPTVSSARSGGSAQPRLSAPFVLPSNERIAEDRQMPISNMRGTIARRLVESKTEIPHFYLEIEVDAGPLIEMRESLNANLQDVLPERGGFKLTVNDLILKATTEAIRRVPEVNVSWQGNSIIQHGAVHLAFGVAVEDGLVTPVIRDAHTRDLRQIHHEAKVLIQKARDKKLEPEEMSGSTFTITNLGMYGISTFFGIINPPNAAILSVGATRKIPVVDASNTIIIGHRMNIGISGDHRVVDGVILAKFLNTLKEILETPALMLM